MPLYSDEMERRVTDEEWMEQSNDDRGRGP